MVMIVNLGDFIIYLPSSCSAFSQAFTVNSFRWRIRDERPGKASLFRSDHMTRNGPTATKYRGLGTRQMIYNIQPLGLLTACSTKGKASLILSEYPWVLLCNLALIPHYAFWVACPDGETVDTPDLVFAHVAFSCANVSFSSPGNTYIRAANSYGAYIKWLSP